MSTPEITRGAQTKLSPFGSGISKRLLTPCRRVGLSRKRKMSTPNSIAKILSDDATVTDTSFTEISDSTPLNHKKSLPKRKSLLNFDSPVLTSKTDQTCSNNEETSCKKKLAKSFSADIFNEERNTVEVITVKALIHNSSEGVLASQIIDSEEKENNLLNQSFTKVEVAEERAGCDSDQDFTNEPGRHSKGKSKDSKSKKNKKMDKEIYVVSDHSIKECKVTLRKLSHENIELNLNKGEKRCDLVNQGINLSKKGLLCNNEEPSDESIVKQIKSNSNLIDDDDFFTNSPNNCTPSRKVDNKKKEAKLGKKKSTEIQRRHSVNLLNDDDDIDPFTSTPERERNEKKDLLDKLKSLEVEVKLKRKKLEDLKQAAVYRKKHNVEELKALTETWRSGCISGLKVLLTQLQAHGPMDMPTLLSKLNISSEIYSKLPLAT